MIDINEYQEARRLFDKLCPGLAELLGAHEPKHIIIVDNPQHTHYPWGDISDIAGQSLIVMEKSPHSGDCLCISPKGLVDIHSKDIKED